MNERPTIDELLKLIKKYSERCSQGTKVGFYHDGSGAIWTDYGETHLFSFNSLLECKQWLEHEIEKSKPKHNRKPKRPTLVKTFYEHYRVPEWDWGFDRVDIGDLFDMDKANHKPLDKWLFRYKQNEKPFVVRVRGGKTTCTLVLSNGESIVGTSYCSMSDNFCYKTGRDIARERAMKQYVAAHGE